MPRELLIRNARLGDSHVDMRLLDGRVSLDTVYP